MPDKAISHWLDANRNIRSEAFYEAHLQDVQLADDEYAFKLGYYCHLVADQVWLDKVWRPKKVTPLYAEPLAKDADFVYEIKRDWYGLDFLYLRAYPQSLFYTDFVPIKRVPDYVEGVFPVGAFTQRVHETRAFYLGGPDWTLDRPYRYLSQAEWDAYVQLALHRLQAALADKGVLQI